jgi:hypothetical protein
MSLDPSQDPDRFVAGPSDLGPLDPAKDPDRFASSGGRTLPEMLGESESDEPRNNLEWLVGLVSVIGFLVLVSFVLSHAR